jgi:hypothetical protein
LEGLSKTVVSLIHNRRTSDPCLKAENAFHSTAKFSEALHASSMQILSELRATCQWENSGQTKAAVRVSSTFLHYLSTLPSSFRYEHDLGGQRKAPEFMQGHCALYITAATVQLGGQCKTPEFMQGHYALYVTAATVQLLSHLQTVRTYWG